MQFAGLAMQGLGMASERDASKQASNALTGSSKDAIGLQLALANQSRSDNLGRIIGGNEAFNQLLRLRGLGTYTPSYGGPITMSGGETKQKKRTLFDKLTDPANIAKGYGGTSYDPMGFFSTGTETTPTTFNFGGDSGGVSGGMGGSYTPGTGFADYSQFYQTPDYLVRLSEGTQALDRGAAARGRLYSGGFDADRMRFGANLGATGFNDYTSALERLAGIGGQAISQVGQSNQNFANQATQQLNNAGQARADAFINNANSTNNFLGSLAQGWGQYQAGKSTTPGIGPVQREQIPIYY